MYKNCGCNTKPCNCSGDYLSSSPFCGVIPACANPEKCSETFSTDCIVFTGDSVVDLGIPNGTRLTTLLQLLMKAIVDPGCVLPTAPCLSVLGFASTAISATTASFSWGQVGGTVNYQLQYALAGPMPTWIMNPVTSNTFDTIGGLTPNTQYYVKVSTNCSANSCFSLTLLINTKAN